MSKTKYGFLPLFFLFFLLQVANAQISPLKYETRAVWLTTLNGLDWPRTKATTAAGREKQKKELTDILDKYQELHLNTVLLQTRVRGSMIYPSAYEGWDPCLTGQPGRDPGYDPLQFAIEECHKRGLELHCWMVTIPSGNATVHRQLGQKTVTKTHPNLVKKIKDYWYLDPGNPQTPEYLATLCEEITRKYDIDGIHFDFIRYIENSSDILDRDSYRRYGNKQDKATWRRNNITACVRAMYKAIKNIKPWVKVTCAPLGKYRDTDRFSSTGWNGYNKVYQEAQKWMKEGIMDGLFPMAYYKGDHFYPFILDWKENTDQRPVTPGLGIYFLHPSEGNWVLADVQRQMNYCRSLGLGVAHYRSKFLTDNTKGLYDWCKKEFYINPALPTPLTWQTTEQPTQPDELKIENNNGITSLHWNEVIDNTTKSYVTYNVYRSSSPVVDINLPQNLISARQRSTDYHEETYGMEYYYAITSVNRFGIESAPLQSLSGPKAEPQEFEYSAGSLKVTNVSDAKAVIVKDLNNRVVKTFSIHDKMIVSDLQTGSYQVILVKKDGRNKHLGIFLK